MPDLTWTVLVEGTSVCVCKDVCYTDSNLVSVKFDSMSTCANMLV